MGVTKMPKYTIRLYTPPLEHAGTNADVEGRLLGKQGDTGWRVLDNAGDDREQESLDYYYVIYDETIGDVSAVQLRVKKFDDDSPDWYLSTSFLVRVDTRDTYELPPFGWFKASTAQWEYGTLPARLIGKLDPSVPNKFLW